MKEAMEDQALRIQVRVATVTTNKAGAGSGGSVWLIANCLGGTGVVSVKGGSSPIFGDSFPF